MKKIEGYLSRRAQHFFPGVMVYEEQGRWILERPNQPDFGLGDSEHEAHQAITALLSAERQRRGLGKTEIPNQ